ncbi:MAG: hypothetical protein ACO24D_19380 [bacterium]
MEILDTLLQAGVIELAAIALGAPAGVVMAIKVIKAKRKKNERD